MPPPPAAPSLMDGYMERQNNSRGRDGSLASLDEGGLYPGSSLARWSNNCPFRRSPPPSLGCHLGGLAGLIFSALVPVTEPSMPSGSRQLRKSGLLRTGGMTRSAQAPLRARRWLAHGDVPAPPRRATPPRATDAPYARWLPPAADPCTSLRKRRMLPTRGTAP
jgi:hypothetical protein